MSTNFWLKVEQPEQTVIFREKGFDIVKQFKLDPDDPDWHIGKRYSGASGLSFIWAMDFPNIHHVLLDNPDDPVVIDENGHEYTGMQFLNMLNNDIEYHDTTMIGQWFG